MKKHEIYKKRFIDYQTECTDVAGQFWQMVHAPFSFAFFLLTHSKFSYVFCENQTIKKQKKAKSQNKYFTYFTWLYIKYLSFEIGFKSLTAFLTDYFSHVITLSRGNRPTSCIFKSSYRVYNRNIVLFYSSSSILRHFA